MLLHAAEASGLTGIAALGSLEGVLGRKALVLGVGQTLLNEVFHKLVVVIGGVSIGNPLAVGGCEATGDHDTITIAMDG